MSATEIIESLAAVPAAERAMVARQVLEVLYPARRDVIDRLLRRLEHPEVPEEFWEAVEELDEGKTMVMRDEDFEHRPE